MNRQVFVQCVARSCACEVADAILSHIDVTPTLGQRRQI